MTRKLISTLIACLLLSSGVPARAQTLEKEMSALAASLTKEMVAQGSKNVALTDFTDLQGQPTELGRFLSEQLSVEMVLAKGVALLDRANFKSILAEHKLTEEGLVNPANARKLGEFAGVDTILIGGVTVLDAGIVLTVKAISTASSKIVAAGKITFQKTADLQWIANRGLPGTSSTESAPATAGVRGTAYANAGAIASKDIGSVRVLFKSVLPFHVTQPAGRARSGLRVSLELTNLDTQGTVAVAANAEPGGDSRPYAVLRSSLVDDRGGIWTLSESALSGLAFVRAGTTWAGQAYSATEVTRLLALRDNLGRDYNDPSDPLASRLSSHRFDATRVNFVHGSATIVRPGQTLPITMDFVSATPGGPAPTIIQLSTEIVVGTEAQHSRRSYSLHNLTFDRVTMPGTGS